MRGGQAFHVEPLAIRSHAAMELRPIPGGDAGFVIARLLLGVKPAPGDLVGLADLVDAAALGQRPLLRIIGAAFAGKRVRGMRSRGTSGQNKAERHNTGRRPSKMTHETNPRCEPPRPRAPDARDNILRLPPVKAALRDMVNGV